MVEQTGIQASFDEHEVKLYLEQVTNEVYCSFTDLIQYVPYSDSIRYESEVAVDCSYLECLDAHHILHMGQLL